MVIKCGQKKKETTGLGWAAFTSKGIKVARLSNKTYFNNFV